MVGLVREATWPTWESWSRRDVLIDMSERDLGDFEARTRMGGSRRVTGRLVTKSGGVGVDVGMRRK
jgi:hypothetical protein